MKKNAFPIALVFAALLLNACRRNGSDSIEQANKMNEQKDTANAILTAGKDDAEFVVEASSGGMMEVQLGNIAQEKAADPRVKNYGSMMVRDHTKTNAELKGLASTKDITLPQGAGEEHQKHIDELMQKTGSDFDKSYMEMMVKDHEEDIDAFQKSSDKGKDIEIKAFASKTLPVLKVHLDSAKAIRDYISGKK